MSATARTRASTSGFSLVELMVALLLGLLLTIAAVTIHAQAQRAVRALESTARLQEAARLAFDVLEDDLRMAGYWGLLDEASRIANRAAPLAGLPAPFTGPQGARIDHCGGASSRWAIDLDRPLDGSNDGYGLACAPYADAAAPGADVLVVRRASEVAPTVLDPDRIHVHADRLAGWLYVPQPGCADPQAAGCVPAALPPPAGRSRALVVRAYYVATRSTQRTDVPALRRKSFGSVNSATVATAVADEEIVTGIEDLQARLGVDTDADGNVDSYIDPGAVPAGAQVVSATVWLRVRAEERETGHVDGRSYQYASMASAFAPADGYRRIVVSKTLQLRNATR